MTEPSNKLAIAPIRGNRMAQLVAGVMLVPLVAVCWMLWPQWTRNPDLSHGFFVPLIFLLLLWESRQQQPPRFLPPQWWRLVILFGSVSASVGLLAMAGLLAASLGWSHALVQFVTAASLCAYLFACVVVLSSEAVRAVQFNWIALTGIFLWLLAAPLPHGTYSRITLQLQELVTGLVLESLQFLGIPARQRGNVIELAQTTVGVEEACSGIRSLISCTFAGFFFAAWQVRIWWGRLLLIALAPALAIVMNFFRSLTLTLLANKGVDISIFWHDATGFAILAVTAGALAGLAVLLSPSRSAATPPERAEPQKPGKLPPWTKFTFWSGNFALLFLCWFFFMHTRPAEREHKAAPDLARLLPYQVEGWQVVTAKDLYVFANVLQTDVMYERTYLRPEGDSFTQVTVYIAYWQPGQASVSLVASHTPDACWPGSGWIAKREDKPRRKLNVPGRQLPPVEYRSFVNSADFQQHVWFWHLYDGRPINYRDPYSVPALLELAVLYGFRREGDQFFIRLSSNKPWDQLSGEPLIREIISNLTKVGL